MRNMSSTRRVEVCSFVARLAILPARPVSARASTAFRTMTSRKQFPLSQLAPGDT